jgi:hypothetical protein
MKTKFIAALAATALFTSCQKDFSEEYGTLALTSTIATSQNSYDCKACSYSPVCAGSTYTYVDRRGRAASGGAQSTFTLSYISDTTIEGKVYKKMKGANLQTSFFNCTAGISTEIFITNFAQADAYVKTTALKANESIGASWVDRATVSPGIDEINTYSIIEKGISRVVENKTYADVIHVRQVVTVSTNGATPVNTAHCDYYMAKGIGLIECATYDDENGGILLQNRSLINATIL